MAQPRWPAARECFEGLKTELLHDAAWEAAVRPWSSPSDSWETRGGRHPGVRRPVAGWQNGSLHAVGQCSELGLKKEGHADPCGSADGLGGTTPSDLTDTS